MIDHDARLELIRLRAAAQPVRRLTCTFCTLVYRHTAGVRRWRRWFCSLDCAGRWGRGDWGPEVFRALLGRRSE